jgi:spore coat polysaccharide biosynthesis protein SpsF (cytidylyltransferase family)
MGSTRLPGKAMLPLAGKSLTQNMIERVRRATKLDYVVLAYPLKDNDAFKEMLLNFRDTPGVPLGSWASQDDENDLVARYLSAARAYDANIIVRIPGDNPCVEAEYIDKAVEEYLDGPYLFYSNTSAYVATGNPDWQKSWMYVDGIGAEVSSVSRWKWLYAKTRKNAEWREHPHQFFHDFFNKHYEIDATWDCIEVPMVRNETIRLDVNTEPDYHFVKRIYDHFGHNRFHISEVLAYLETLKEAKA